VNPKTSRHRCLVSVFTSKQCSSSDQKAGDPLTLGRFSPPTASRTLPPHTCPRYPAAGARSTSQNTGASFTTTFPSASPNTPLKYTRTSFLTSVPTSGSSHGRNTSSSSSIFVAMSCSIRTTPTSHHCRLITSRLARMSKTSQRKNTSARKRCSCFP